MTKDPKIQWIDFRADKFLDDESMSRLIRRLSNASISSLTSIGTPASHSNGLPGVVGSVGPMDVPADADPQACLEVFCSHWAQIKGEYPQLLPIFLLDCVI